MLVFTCTSLLNLDVLSTSRQTSGVDRSDHFIVQEWTVSAVAKKRKKTKSKKSKKRKKTKSKKSEKIKRRAQPRRSKRNLLKARRETRRKRRRRSGRVKHLSRRDQRGASKSELEAGAQERWRQSKRRVRGHQSARRYYGSHVFGWPRRRPQRRRAVVYASTQRGYGDREIYDEDEGCEEFDVDGRCLEEPTRPAEIEGDRAHIRLELSGGMWMYHVPQRLGDSGGDIMYRAEYRVSPSVSYQAMMTLLTPYAAVSVGYVGREGVSFMGAEGSGLDVKLAVPWLARWSVGYQAVSFKNGAVRLLEDNTPIERQSFTFEATEYRLQYQAVQHRELSVALWGRWHQRGLPRQIYLAESLGEEEPTLYFDISDQLLWIESRAIDVGFEVSGYSAERSGWLWSFGLGVGGGGYELRTPLGNSGLDRGTLLTLPIYAKLGYRVPLNDVLGIKFDYSLELLMLEPIGLPDQLERELEEEGDISGLSLSFGSLDVSQRVWMSLYTEW